MTLPIGLISTIVESYLETNSHLIEFSDDQDCEYAMTIVPIHDLLIVHLDLNLSAIDRIATWIEFEGRSD